MGAFNVVILPEKCGNCGQIVNRRVQFKYGEVWQHEYNLGDELIWGAKNIGNPQYRKVVVDGAGENCPNCRAEGNDYEVWITSGKILDVRRATGKYDFVKTHGKYILIEP